MHQVVHRFVHKRDAVELRREGPTPVLRHAAGGRKLTELRKHLYPKIPIDGIDARVAAMIRNVLHCGWNQQVGIAIEIARSNHFVAGVVGIVESEVVTPGIKRMAELSLAGTLFDSETVRAEAHCTARNVHRCNIVSIRKAQGLTRI